MLLFPEVNDSEGPSHTIQVQALVSQKAKEIADRLAKLKGHTASKEEKAVPAPAVPTSEEIQKRLEKARAQLKKSQPVRPFI